VGRSFDEINAVLGDIMTLATGNPMFAIEGNAESAADSALGGRKKDALGFALSTAGSAAAPVLGGVGGAVGKAAGGAGGGLFGAGVGEAGAKAGEFLGSTAGEIAGSAGSQFLEPALAKSLGLNQPRQNAPPMSAPLKTVGTGTGGGAGPGLGAGGLDVQGGTAPKIFPYVQPATQTGSGVGGPPPAARSIGAAAPNQSQARGI
jgi:hypothetical protein